MAALSMPRSPAEAPHLGRLQRWMQACMMANGPVESAVETPAAVKEFPASQAPGLIRASRTLAPLERLDIYRGMYDLRLVEALRVDYPGLLKFLGEKTFEELARLYIASCPPESYTLNRLGDRLPDFLSQVDGIHRPGFVEALARLELAETFVFDEEESPVAAMESFGGLSEDQWGRLRLTPIRALRLLRLNYPAHEFMQAIRRDEALPSLRPRRTHLIVHRREYGLFHLSLSAPAFALFQALAERAPLDEAMQSMFDAGGGSQKQVFEWFRQWFSERLFSSVEIY
ncbi:MAG: putative DNA-binding domain-containing protein [Acidobacteria bacterium]|nr:putative DNA-binding domain-containing protein [Acidobacteriota bacterium]